MNTIYLAARAAAATNPAMKKIAENMSHGNWPKGPAGKRPVMAAFFAGALCSGLGYFVQSQGSRALILLMG